MAHSKYGASVNQRFLNNKVNLVDIVTRFNDTINGLIPAEQKRWNANLKVALSTFRRNNPGLKSLNSSPRQLNRSVFYICEAKDKPLVTLFIDTTMQRQLILNWVLHIITNFRSYQAQPIQVYSIGNGGWGGWDGQHTAVALYIIAVFGLGMKVDDVVVPCNVYNISSRGQLRSVFISNNTHTGKMRGKTSLDHIDIVEQMIYGVLIDGIKTPEWVTWCNKWKILSSHDMFFAAEKFNNIDQTGAISRLDELEKASESVVGQFAIYGQYVIDQQETPIHARPIDTKELPLIIELLKMFEAENIKLTRHQIESMAQHLIDKFDADFTTHGPFWTQVHSAVTNAWSSYNENQNILLHLWGNAPRNNKNIPTGYNFLWSQLAHTWAPGAKVKMPKRPGFAYTLSSRDLF